VSAKNWNEEGAKRIVYILRREIVCNQRELERRISEVGPGGWRVEPVYVSGGKRMLIREEQVNVHDSSVGEFYSLSGANKKEVNKYLEEKVDIYKRFSELSQTERRLGGVAERVYAKAMEQAENVLIHGTTGEVDTIDGKVSKRTIDGGGYDRMSDTKFGVEVKNIREWAYPDSWEVWKALQSCAELEVMPVYIARQIAYPTFKFFGEVGAIGYTTYKQFWDVTLKDRLEDVRVKFGFKDIVFPVEYPVSDEDRPLVNAPTERDVALFTKTVPKMAKQKGELFMKQKDMIWKYADRGLGKDNYTHPRRGELFRKYHIEAFGHIFSY